MITSDLRLNEPRYVKLPDIMKAKKKPIETLRLESLGADTACQLRIVRHDAPATRQKGVIVKDVTALLAALRDRGVLK